MTEKTAKELLAAIRALTEALRAGQQVHYHYPPQPIFTAPPQPNPYGPSVNPNVPWGTTGGTVSGQYGAIGSGGYTNTINQ